MKGMTNDTITVELLREDIEVLLNPPLGPFANREWWAAKARAEDKLKSALTATEGTDNGC